MAYYIRLSYDHKHLWQLPSGAQGKSTNNTTHEHRYGFGFEEWFFNSRRYKDETGKAQAHFAYLQAFNRAAPPDESKDLVLYTLASNSPQPTNRYIVARIKTGNWRFIDHKRYLKLKNCNAQGIRDMQAELQREFQRGSFREGLVWNDVLTRFKQQLNCQDWYGQASDTYRLWNIEFLKTVKVLMQRVNENTPCLDWHVNNLNRFKLNNSENFDHNNCKIDFI
ncbi:MAG: hypothetical protein IPM95_12500 [Sphingobacteriales bacterium]|nr:hypothetical protein [Sphingobacteriales bacterium]